MVNYFLFGYNDSKDILYNSSAIDYAIAIRNIFYLFNEIYTTKEYIDLILKEMILSKGTIDQFVKYFFGYWEFVQFLKQQLDQLWDILENKALIEALNAIKNGIEQQPIQIAYLGRLCCLPFISISVLVVFFRCRYQRQKDDNLKLQARKDALENALLLERKNKLLDQLKEKLRELENDECVGALEKMISNEMHLDELSEQLAREFQHINPDFFLRLKEVSSNKLTALELKHCAYIYLKLTTKEIAATFYIEPKSVLVTKYRIKQKLALSKEDDLDLFLKNLA